MGDAGAIYSETMMTATLAGISLLAGLGATVAARWLWHHITAAVAATRMAFDEGRRRPQGSNGRHIAWSESGNGAAQERQRLNATSRSSGESSRR